MTRWIKQNGELVPLGGGVGKGIPAGGGQGHFLVKDSANDFDTSWAVNNISSMSDVNTDGVADDNVLVYDASTSQWQSASIEEVAPQDSFKSQDPFFLMGA